MAAMSNEAEFIASSVDEEFFSRPIFGTMERGEASEVGAAVTTALKAGFRHFDLAEHYASQMFVGDALRAWAGDTVPRSELWLTTKIDGMPCGEYSELKERLEAMIDAVAGNGYVDLLLIHYPAPRGTDLGGDPGVLSTPDAWTFFKENIAQAWANMARLKSEGLARNIGVSNFAAQHLEELQKHVTPECPVFANEVYIDAAHPQSELVLLMASRGIRALAYRPITFLPNYGLLEGLTEGLQARAEEVGAASPHQVVLWWLLSKGITPIVSSSSEEHMTANLAAPSSDALTKLKDMATLSDSLVDMQEMIDMMGGCDEYAQAFAAMGVDVATT